jgi:CRISPR-associated protein Cas2
VQYVVCYDIADDRRRDRLASALLDFGPRAQESVFTANLDEELAAKLEARIGKLIDEKMDRVHIFVLCAACSVRTKAIGIAEVAQDRPFYIV